MPWQYMCVFLTSSGPSHLVPLQATNPQLAKAGFRVQGSGLGFRFRVQGSGFRV